MAQFGTSAGCDSGVGVCVCSRCSTCCCGCGSFQTRGSAGAGASSRHFPRDGREGNLFGSCLWCRHVRPAGLGDPGCRRAAMEGPGRRSVLPSRHPVLAARLMPLGSVPVLFPGLRIPRRRRDRQRPHPSPLQRVLCHAFPAHAARVLPRRPLLPAVPACAQGRRLLPALRWPWRLRGAAGTARLLPASLRPAPVQLCSSHSFTGGPWKCLRYFCIYTQQCQLSYLPSFLFPNTGICAGFPIWGKNNSP